MIIYSLFRDTSLSSGTRLTGYRTFLSFFAGAGLLPFGGVDPEIIDG